MSCWIVGISAYTHDASVAVLHDGEVVFTAEEERFNRIKHSDAFPRLALQAALKYLDLNPEEVARFAYFYAPLRGLAHTASHMLRYFPASLSLMRSSAAGHGQSYLRRLRDHFCVGTDIQKAIGLRKRPQVKCVRHHLCHASSAFYASPYEEAAILTLDGRGEDTTTAFFHGRGTDIRLLDRIKIPHSLGHLYAAITWYLGFRPFADEWKVMGMSAYGKGVLQRQFDELLSCDERSFRLNLKYFDFHIKGTSSWLSSQFIRTFGPARKPNEPLEERHFELAFALQKAVERTALHLARALHRRSGAGKLCLSGGVAFNVLMNKRIIEDGPFENVYIQPIAGDAGASVGAALLAYYDRGCLRRQRAFISPYLGPDFSGAKVADALQARQLALCQPADLYERTARALADGRIVGWFQGRLEAGPRALGNRSILAHPGSKEMKDRLNRRIKRRESFRPFAPSVLKEKAGLYFKMPRMHDSPYMILAGEALPEMRDRIPAVIHADGTARVHTVEQTINPQFYRLILEFEKLTGLPLLLNTSFNENEPIVCTPQEAIECYLRTELDVLVMGDYWVEKPLNHGSR